MLLEVLFVLFGAERFELRKARPLNWAEVDIYRHLTLARHCAMTAEAENKRNLGVWAYS